MAEWIPACKSLPRKREVIAIAAATSRSRHEVVGLLLDFWAWADEESADGQLPGMTPDSLNALFPGSDASFWAAVISAGWLLVRSRGLEVPKFQRWLGRSAKRRLQETERKRRSREDGGEPERPAAVRGMSARHADKKRTTGQDRTGQDMLGDESPNPSCPETPQAASSGPNDAAEDAAPSAPDRVPDAARLRDGPGEVCGSTPPRPPPVLLFPTDGPLRQWGLLPDTLDELRGLFPSIDVLEECRKALAWVLAAPERKKTAKGMRKFLTGWLTRCQDRGPPRSPAAPAGRPGESISERIARIRREEACRRPGTTGPSTTG